MSESFVVGCEMNISRASFRYVRLLFIILPDETLTDFIVITYKKSTATLAPGIIRDQTTAFRLRIVPGG